MRKLFIYLVSFFTALFFFQIAFAVPPTPAKITAVHITNPPGFSRFTFEIDGGLFHYQWQFSSDQKKLNINIDNVVSVSALPKSALLLTPVVDYQARKSGPSTLQLQFQLKTAQNPKIYTLPASATQKARLLIDFKSAIVSRDANTTLDSVRQPLSKAKYSSPTKPKLTLPGNAASRPIMIVIDPGHGGKDSGAVGPDNTYEKNVVLAISKSLQQSFNKQPGFQTQLTRDYDVFIPLRERLAIARRYKADIFIAIHADAAYKNQDATGASVFALSERGATSEMARWLARKENESELIYGVIVNKDQVLRSVLLDLSQTHTISVSLEMGREILSKLSNITQLHGKRVEQAAFVVLKSPDIPSLLVETGYITNPVQEQKLNDPVYQRQLADTIMKGVMAYFSQHPPGKQLITT